MKAKHVEQKKSPWQVIKEIVPSKVALDNSELVSMELPDVYSKFKESVDFVTLATDQNKYWTIENVKAKSEKAPPLLMKCITNVFPRSPNLEPGTFEP